MAELSDLNQGNNRGLLSDEMHPISLMRDRMMKADAAGLQICTIVGGNVCGTRDQGSTE